MAAAAPAGATVAAASESVAPIKPYAGYATTVVFSDLGVKSFREAEECTSWMKTFSLLNVEWRLEVNPHQTEDTDSETETETEPATHMEVNLQLRKGSVVALERLNVQFVGLGQCIPVEFRDVTLPIGLHNLDPQQLMILCQFPHSAMPASRDFKSGVSPGNIPDDCLEVRIEMRPSSSSIARPVPPADPQQTLQGLAANLYGAAGCLDAAAIPPDVTLKFSGMHAKAAPLRAHSFLLSLRSSVFRAQFFGPLASKGPPFTCTVPEEVTPAAMTLLLRYFCTDALAGVPLPISDAGALLASAEYYQLPRLVLLCDQSLELALSPETALETLQLAHRFSRNELRVAAMCCAAAHVDTLLDTPAWAQLSVPLQHAVVRTVSKQGEPATIREPAAQAPDAKPERAAKR